MRKNHPRLLEAWEEELDYWGDVIFYEGDNITLFNFGLKTSPLCSLFPVCAGCPIYNKAGKIMCGGTPLNDLDENLSTNKLHHIILSHAMFLAKLYNSLYKKEE